MQTPSATSGTPAPCRVVSSVPPCSASAFFLRPITPAGGPSFFNFGSFATVLSFDGKCHHLKDASHVGRFLYFATFPRCILLVFSLVCIEMISCSIRFLQSTCVDRCTSVCLPDEHDPGAGEVYPLGASCQIFIKAQAQQARNVFPLLPEALACSGRPRRRFPRVVRRSSTMLNLEASTASKNRRRLTKPRCAGWQLPLRCQASVAPAVSALPPQHALKGALTLMVLGLMLHRLNVLLPHLQRCKKCRATQPLLVTVKVGDSGVPNQVPAHCTAQSCRSHIPIAPETSRLFLGLYGSQLGLPSATLLTIC